MVDTGVIVAVSSLVNVDIQLFLTRSCQNCVFVAGCCGYTAIADMGVSGMRFPLAAVDAQAIGDTTVAL